jgi:hypothetical protein
MTDVCVFFNDEVGYSIDLQTAMRLQYCLGDSSACARLAARNAISLDYLPDDLIPTENERSEQLIAAFRRGELEPAPMLAFR